MRVKARPAKKRQFERLVAARYMANNLQTREWPGTLNRVFIKIAQPTYPLCEVDELG